MLSYRHAFHAGNFADVLKHTVLIQLLEYLNKKDKPYCIVDTHAGAGAYLLNQGYALKNREFETGITKLLAQKNLPDSVAAYVELVKRFNQDGPIIHYPGSPAICQDLIRKHDRLFLFELHSTDVDLLADEMGRDKRVKVYEDDGLKASLGLLPPLERRGLVLIDPSYEIKSDYKDVVEAIKSMHKRFATGCFALWYPVVERSRVHAMEKALVTSGIKNVVLFELGIAPDSDALGMTGSGMIVINPPWTLAADMKQVLPWLVGVLGVDGGGSYRVETLVAE